MKNVFILLLLSCLLGTDLFAQNTPFCATDEMHHRLFADRPDLNPGIKRAHERLTQFTVDFEKSEQTKGGGPYIIPVVFHIIHNGGPENINDSQVLDAIKQVNLQFRRLNADTNEIVTEFKQLAADCNIELRLAQLDPNGNCTSGITRTVSPLTLIGDHQVKSLIQWPPDKYLNVYVCNQAAGLAGHALLPAAADTVPEWDGIVMQHSYVGTIGTSDFFRRTVLTHEIGHYLNLQHIWGGNNVPDYYYLPVAQSGNCAFDDEVDDTPLTIGWQNCDLDGQSCGSLDNVQNYMDYAYCARMFTQGQRTRMHACLNSDVANRSNLWSVGNLAATGTTVGSANFCAAKFEANKRVVCVGEEVILTDVSYHGIDAREWSIPGATLSSITDSVITASFNVPGLYTVALSVTKEGNTLNVYEVDLIRVLPAQGTENGVYESFENEVFFDTQWAIVPSNNDVNWAINQNTGFSSDQSISVQNFDAGYNGIFEFISEPIDASGLDALLLTFDYAYARKQEGASEVLQIAVSTDCGDTWSVRRSFFGNSTLSTVAELVPTSFEPIDNSQWNSESVNNISSTFLTNDLLIKFKFDAKGGNNIYLDNIRISHPSVIGIDELDLNEITIFPNPASDNLNFSIPESMTLIGLKIFDITGKELSDELNYSLIESKIETTHLEKGLYQLVFETQIGQKSINFLKY
jgi:hypothetical protein